jgi:hypothetical protein
MSALDEQFPESRELPCGCQLWSHELFDGVCPETINFPPKECCGADLRKGPVVSRVCEHGCCVDDYCGRCGRHNGSGHGPAGCRCGHADWPRGHGTWGEYRMIPTPNGHEYTRRQRARAKGRR